MRRYRRVEKEKRRSWLIGRGCLQGKWKDYTAGKSRKRSKGRKTVSQKKGAIEDGKEANGKKRELRGLVGRGGRTGSRRVG